MERFTRKDETGRFVIQSGDIEKASARLALFEDAYEDLKRLQAQIPIDLEEMRLNGKEKTVRYKEMMGQKLINSSIITFFEQHGIK